MAVAIVGKCLKNKMSLLFKHFKLPHLTIRRRLALLFLFLIFLPLFAYRFALDLQNLLLENQANSQLHTVKHLALILQERPDLWGQTLATQQVLPHLDLNSGSIWLVNTQGKTSYVMGNLQYQENNNNNPFYWLGKSLITGLNQLLNQQNSTNLNPYPEASLIGLGLNHKTGQQYRLNDQNKPVSLMSASPIYSNEKLAGVLIYEQSLSTLFNQTLSHFYYLIGLASSVLLVFSLGILFYATSLSRRILQLSNEVKNLFHPDGSLNHQGLTKSQDQTQDEISQLRRQIAELWHQLLGYEKYLKQLPKTLRHELHNPINRMSLALQKLKPQTDLDLSHLESGINQLNHIINELSEAQSFEQALSKTQLQPIPILPRLKQYFSQVEEGLNSGQPDLVALEIADIEDNLLVKADAFMLEQLFDKLLDNAFEFNDLKQPIQIKIYQQNQELIIEIINSGRPLPAGLESQIFDGMVSVRKEKGANELHLGLGLYLANLIAKAHQAELSAQNIENGVSFKLSLPIVG